MKGSWSKYVFILLTVFTKLMLQMLGFIYLLTLGRWWNKHETAHIMTLGTSEAKTIVLTSRVFVKYCFHIQLQRF